MKQSKSPALTSPWKIGLLVSLLIALTGAGVNYLLMRASSISWTWVNLEPGNFAFHLDPFMDQMFPQVALVTAICLIAYLTITAAVRKYRAYLDSGLDYKQLLTAIQHVDDLDDEASLKRLNKYPELKCFIGEMRSTLKQRDALIEQQNADLEQNAHDTEYEAQIQSDCEALIESIKDKIAKGERRELNLDLGSAELQGVAKAIMDIPVRRESVCGDEEKSRMTELHQNLREASDFITARLDDIARELLSNSQEAKNIESQINALKQVVDPAAAPKQNNEKIGALEQISTGVSNITQLSETLVELSEETKSIAINSALQAGSGEGTLSDLIQLAEGIKEIAKKYEQSAVSYRTVTDELTGQVSTLHKILRDDSGSPEAIITSTVNTISSKMSLWVERIVILSDKIKTLEKSYRVSFKTVEDKIRGYANLKQEDDSTFEIEKTEALQMRSESIDTQELKSTLFDHGGAEGSSENEDVFSADMSNSEPPSFHMEPLDSGIPREQAPESGFDGIVQERNLFESTQDVEESYFADKSIDIRDQYDKIESNQIKSVPETESDQEECTAEMESNWEEPAPQMESDQEECAAEMDLNQEERAPQTGSDLEEHPADDYSDMGTVSFASIGPAPEIRESLDEPIQQSTDIPSESSDTMQETEEEIIDLYALGAVDYVAHHSEQQP